MVIRFHINLTVTINSFFKGTKKKNKTLITTATCCELYCLYEYVEIN